MGELDYFRSAEPNQEVIRRFADAYYGFAQALEQAWTAPEVQQRGAEAYARYLAAVQDGARPDYHLQVQAALDDYLRVVQDAFAVPEIQARAPEAYQTYLQALHHAWQSTDWRTLNPPTLSVIQESIAAAVWLAAAANGSTSQPSP